MAPEFHAMDKETLKDGLGKAAQILQAWEEKQVEGVVKLSEETIRKGVQAIGVAVENEKPTMTRDALEAASKVIEAFISKKFERLPEEVIHKGMSSIKPVVGKFTERLAGQGEGRSQDKSR